MKKKTEKRDRIDIHIELPGPLVERLRAVAEKEKRSLPKQVELLVETHPSMTS